MLLFLSPSSHNNWFYFFLLTFLWYSYPCLFSLSTPLWLYILQFYSPRLDHLILVLTLLPLLVTIVGLFILLPSHTHDIIFLVSSPHWYHFTDKTFPPCLDCLFLVLIVFSFYWALCLSLSWSSARFYLSIHLLLILFSLSIYLIFITLTILTVFIISFCWLSSLCSDFLASPFYDQSYFFSVFDACEALSAIPKTMPRGQL